MILCEKCKIDYDNPRRFFHHVLGDGLCDKHGRFSFSRLNLKELCSECAKEKNKCQVCGKKLK
jgi:hypothetical protein